MSFSVENINRSNNNNNNNNNSRNNFNNNEKELIDNQKEIIKLKKIIEEKDNIILELHLKLKEFRKDIDLLKNKMIYISENAKAKDYPNEFLEIQTIQRFQIAPNNIYDVNGLENKNLNYSYLNLGNMHSPYNKNINNLSLNNLSLKFNLNDYYNKLETDLNNHINSETYLNLPYHNYEKNNNNNNRNNIDNNRDEERIKNDIKFNSSLFFKKCKALMNESEYLELLRIIKLFNAKKLSKNETYRQITDYLEKINIELLKEFYKLFS